MIIMGVDPGYQRVGWSFISIENTIINTLNSLQGEISMVIIAHRLSTIRNVDKIYYIENGEVISSGTFEQLRRDVKNFDVQAKLMGL